MVPNTSQGKNTYIEAVNKVIVTPTFTFTVAFMLHTTGNGKTNMTKNRREEKPGVYASTISFGSPDQRHGIALKDHNRHPGDSLKNYNNSQNVYYPSSETKAGNL
ncbi:hypothetical protein HYALB_00011199 [Hymenoscyphus albidus]|uniref:Uncharacterized protein n=1 Tax=Hymenoscyphus albidus TaxID=595503 RepID=A0A9N9LKF5_9HELO|nr:hypothetical protein HYALB_00011199 [Hymenoscyphus albidus]